MGHWEQTWGRGSAPRVWAHLHAVPCPKACWGSTAAAPHLGPWGSLWGRLGCCLASGGLWASPIPRGDPVSAGQAHGWRLARENVPGIPNISRRAYRSLRLLGLSHATARTASSIPATFRGAAGRVAPPEVTPASPGLLHSGVGADPISQHRNRPHVSPQGLWRPAAPSYNPACSTPMSPLCSSPRAVASTSPGVATAVALVVPSRRDRWSAALCGESEGLGGAGRWAGGAVGVLGGHMELPSLITQSTGGESRAGSL